MDEAFQASGFGTGLAEVLRGVRQSGNIQVSAKQVPATERVPVECRNENRSRSDHFRGERRDVSPRVRPGGIFPLRRESAPSSSLFANLRAILRGKIESGAEYRRTDVAPLAW